MSVIKELLAKAVELESSDVHLKTGSEPFFRIKSELVNSGFEIISSEDMDKIVEDITPPAILEEFEATHEADFSMREPDVGRFRINLYLAEGDPVVAMRHVKDDIPTVEGLNLPPHLNRLADFSRGIVIVAGTTGSGKSTTLAALLGRINRTRRARIVTIEDPIEYDFDDEESVITQREVGLDTRDFTNALTHLLRQDPDVILIGEMRDEISIRTGLMAAQTGHLVFTTLHAGTASVAIPRMLDVFPAGEQAQIRMALAGTDHAIVCQRLIPDTHGSVVPAVEIMINTPTIRKLLEKDQLDILRSAIETGREDGMQTFDQSIYDLIKSGRVTEKEGMRHATNPEALRMNLQGIFLDEGRRILNSG